MGDDWCRMRVKPGVDEAELLALIEEEARAYRDYAFRISDNIWYQKVVFNPYYNEHSMKVSLDEARQNLNDLTKQVNTLVDIDSESLDYCHRMFIGRRHIFPIEMRLKAYRSFLPHQVESALNIWRNYIHSVQNGGYTQYLFDWYMYFESYRAGIFWQILVETSQAILTGEISQKYVKSLDIPKQVLEIPKPSSYDPPRFADYKPSDSIDWEGDKGYLELQDIFKALHDIRHQWNRNIRHRKHFKFHRGGYPFFDYEINLRNYIDMANEDAIEWVFQWIQRCINDGMGLYLSV